MNIINSNYTKRLNEDKVGSRKIINFDNLSKISAIIAEIEIEQSEMAEAIFEYLTGRDDEDRLIVSDEDIINGCIKPSNNSKINKYLQKLNKMFLLSRNQDGVRILSRDNIKNFDLKLYTLLMCSGDGDISIDSLCNIVNIENNARFPKTKIGIKTVMRVLNALNKQTNR